MKKILTLLAAPLLFGACGLGERPAVSGELSGIESDTLLATYFPTGHRDMKKTDTIPMRNGKFEMRLDCDSAAYEVYLFAKPSSKPNKDGSIQAFSMRSIPLMVLPGQPVSVKGTMESYLIKGGEFYDELEQVNRQCMVYYSKIDSLSLHCVELSKKGVPNDSIAQLYKQTETWMRKTNDIKRDYIRQHPDSEVSVYMASQLSPEMLAEALDALGEKAKNGLLGPLYRERKAAWERQQAIKKAAENIQPGKEAPDFTLKDLEGKDFSLASLRGKYVVLDFWGSWCGWCVKGFPDMKKAYEKHKGKVEFVGVDCNDTEEKWKKAVAEHELPWIHVRNEGNPDVAAMYAVNGYPTKIIIAPDGKIAKVVIGESPAFYKDLDDLLK